MSFLSNPTTIKNLGITAVCLLGIVIVLQLLLAMGILPVTMAWGGRHTELNPSLRWASLGAVLILAGFGYVIARRSGLLPPAPSLLIKIMSWLVTIYLAFNTVMNFLSVSQAEKWTFGPLTLVLVLICILISASRVPAPVNS